MNGDIDDKIESGIYLVRPNESYQQNNNHKIICFDLEEFNVSNIIDWVQKQYPFETWQQPGVRMNPIIFALRSQKKKLTLEDRIKLSKIDVLIYGAPKEYLKAPYEKQNQVLSHYFVKFFADAENVDIVQQDTTTQYSPDLNVYFERPHWVTEEFRRELITRMNMESSERDVD